VENADLRFGPLAGEADYELGLFAGSSELALTAGPDQPNHFDWIHCVRQSGAGS